MSIYAIKAISVGRPCRVRLYENDDAAYADFKRPFTEPPTGQHGVVLDVNFTEENRTYWKMTPIALTGKDPSQCKLVIEPPTNVTLDSEKVS